MNDVPRVLRQDGDILKPGVQSVGCKEVSSRNEFKAVVYVERPVIMIATEVLHVLAEAACLRVEL